MIFFTLKCLSGAFLLTFLLLMSGEVIITNYFPHLSKLYSSNLSNILYFNLLYYFYFMYRLGGNYYLLLIFFIVVLILFVFVIQLFYYSPLAVKRYSDDLEPSTKIGRILSKKFQLIEEYTPSKDRSATQHPMTHIENIKASQSNSSTPSITTSPIQIPHLTPNITPNPLSSLSTSTTGSAAISEICSSPNNQSRRRRSSSISLPG